MLFIVQTSYKKTEIDFQMNANELYPIVKPAIIVGICGQTELVTSFIEHAFRYASYRTEQNSLPYLQSEEHFDFLRRIRKKNVLIFKFFTSYV